MFTVDLGDGSMSLIMPNIITVYTLNSAICYMYTDKDVWGVESWLSS